MYLYQYGFKTKEDAHDGVEQLYANGEIDLSSKPEVKSYKAKSGKIRYGIYLSE